jgi:biotin carboxylase
LFTWPARTAEVGDRVTTRTLSGEPKSIRGRTLLVLGAGPDQLPTLRAARRLGCTVVAADRRADACGAALADRFLPISIREPRAIAAALGDLPVHGVIAPASDVAQPALNALADHYGTPWRLTEKALRASVDKGAFRAALEALPYPRCRFAQGTSLAELRRAARQLRWPLVVKPADSSGGKGITAVDRESELAGAVQRARQFSYAGEVIVEEMVAGRHLSAECFLLDGKAVFVALSEKGHTGPPHFLTVSHCVPAPVDPEVRAAAVRLIEDACAAVKHVSGPANFDLVLDRDGDLYPIEMGARMGGSGIANLLTAAYGVDLVAASIRLALGVATVPVVRFQRVAMLHILGVERAGQLTAVRGLPAALAVPGTVHAEVFPAVGSYVAPYTTASHKVAVLVAVGDEHPAVRAAAAAARGKLHFDIDDIDGLSSSGAIG